MTRGASTWPVFRPFKGYGGISLWDAPTELHGGSSGRVKVPPLAESGLSPPLLRALHGHHQLEEPPIDPDPGS